MVARAVAVVSDVPGFGLALALTSCMTLGPSPHWLKEKSVPLRWDRGDRLAGEARHRRPPLRKRSAGGSVHASCCPSLQVVGPSPACHRGRD